MFPSFAHRHGARRLLVALALFLAPGFMGPAAAAPTHWFDPATGLAIGGYDPLAYFTRRAPRKGLEEHEYTWRGSVWRFLNPGNQAAFARSPNVYAPRFSGYDPFSIANGRPTSGHPGIWAIHERRLYIFHNSANRRLWARDPSGIIARAEKNWPRVGRTLPGNSTP